LQKFRFKMPVKGGFGGIPLNETSAGLFYARAVLRPGADKSKEQTREGWGESHAYACRGKLLAVQSLSGETPPPKHKGVYIIHDKLIFYTSL
jgi:hypothetical protein